MKKYFFYGFIILWGLLSFLFYKDHVIQKNQKELMIDSDIVHSFEISKEFFHSSLKNIFFQSFNSFIIKKSLSQINNGSKSTVMLLKNLIDTNFYNHKDLLKGLVIYDAKGKEVLSMTDIKRYTPTLNDLKRYSKEDSLKFEYFSKEDKHFIKIHKVMFQGAVIGYIKQVVSLKKFMNRFLPNYNYQLLRSNNKGVLSIYLIPFESINEKLYFALNLNKKGDLGENLIKELYQKILIAGLILLILTILLYNNFKKEKILKDRIKWQKEFFRKIIDTSPNPIFVKDKNRKYLMANKAMSNIFDIYSGDILVDQKNEELGLNEKVVNSLKKDEDRALKSKEIVYKQIQKVGDQYYKFVHVPLYNLEYPVNEEMILGFATNITPEVEKRNELAKLNTQLKLDIFDEMTTRVKINEKFKKIFDNIHDGMFICKIDDEGKLSEFLDLNASGSIFLKQFMKNKSDDPNRIFEGFKFKYNRKSKRFESKKYSYLLKIPNGKDDVNFKISCNIIHINGEFHAAIFVQHVDEIMKLKKEKKEKQILIENIFEKAKSGIAVINGEGKVIRFNKSFYESLGLDEEYFSRENFFSIFKEQSHHDMKREHFEFFNLKEDIFHEYSFFVNGKHIDTIASSTLIEDANNKPFRLFIFEDITKQKSLEKEQLRNSRIIAQQAKMAEMGEMIGAIAHQWRQPLNAINAAAIKLNFSTSLDMFEKDEVLEKTKFIEKQSLKMSETINDFMNFFKPSKSKEDFTIRSVYKKIYDFLEPQLINREIELELDTDTEITLYGFENEFEHILLNLINNSKDAFDDISSDQKKYIKISAYDNNESNIITISDNAGGIPNNILSKVFNPYFTTKEEGKGTGIGLYMTKTIIDKHFDGSIKVDNTDEGAEFTLVIPKRGEENVA